MKIAKLEIRNLLGIREFSWDGKSMELRGTNGVGKTAVIDAIRLALQNKIGREVVLSKGETEGEVLLETDSGIRAASKIRTEKADYRSVRQEGERGEKTESFIREIFTEMQLDPIRFSQMDEKEQNRIILDLIDFKWDIKWIEEQFGEIPPDVDYTQNILRVLHDIQSEGGAYFQKRQELNHDLKFKKELVEKIGMSLPEGYNAAHWEAVNLATLYSAIERVRRDNKEIETAKAAVAGRDAKARGFQADFEIEKAGIEKASAATKTSLEKRIQDLEAQIREANKELAALSEITESKIKIAAGKLEAAVAELNGEVKACEEKAKNNPVDFSQMQAEAEETERMKSFINEYHRMTAMQSDIETLQVKTADLTAKIERARTLPGEIIAQAQIPIAGLTIENGIPLINGLPVSNLSEGEKLALCISVAIQREGALKMLLIDGIERLAEDKRNEIYAMLKSKGVQFIATLTDNSEALTVHEI